MDIGPGAAAAQRRRLRARSEPRMPGGRPAAPRPPFSGRSCGTTPTRPPENHMALAVGR